jgi:hypothetical protein
LQILSGCTRLILRSPRLGLGVVGRQPRRGHGGITGGRLGELVLGLLGCLYSLLGRREVLLGGVRFAQGTVVLSPGHRYLLGVARVGGRIAVHGRLVLVGDGFFGELLDLLFGSFLSFELIGEVGYFYLGAFLSHLHYLRCQRFELDWLGHVGFRHREREHAREDDPAPSAPDHRGRPSAWSAGLA